ncbi:MAG: BrnT family toxin [Rhodoferax sp.]|nr:BrnT family toxin [Rhodoferax sp.]
MQIAFDPAKQAKTLAERGLDFADAAQVFADISYTVADIRADYGEQRFMTIGLLAGREVVLIWTPRGTARRIISMRYANEREIAKYRPAMG